MAATAPGADLRMDVIARSTHRSSAAASVDHVGEQAGVGGRWRQSNRSPVRVIWARNRRSATRRAGTRIMAGATPTRTSLKAKVRLRWRHRQVGDGDQPEAARPGVPVDPGDDRLARRADGPEDLGQAGGQLPARSDRSAPEQNTLPGSRQHDRPAPSRRRRRRARPSASSSSRRDERALRLWGESRVRVRTESRWAMWTSSTVTNAQCRGPAQTRESRLPGGNV